MSFRILFIFLICLTACAEDKIQRPASSDNSQKMESSNKYNDLARKYLSEKNLTWGEPIGSGEEGDNLYLSYETPFAEKKVLGVRVIQVNKRTGEITVQKRR